jgi:hypothetical protein
MTFVDVPEIPPLDRFGMYAMLGLVRVMEPHTEELMLARNEAERVGDEYDSPHSRPWFVSYHGSEFPGEPADACKRYLLYRMMNIPRTEAMPPWVTTTGTVGKAGELDIADAWYKGGRLLAVPEDPEIKWARVAAYMDAVARGDMETAKDLSERMDIHQLGFEDPNVWMTVSTDLPILPPGWRRPHIVEVKCKADEVVEEMLNGRLLQRPDGTIEKVGRGPDDKHRIQLKATIGLAHEFDWGEVGVCKNCWRILYSDVISDLLQLPRGQYLPWSDGFGYCKWCKDCDVEFFHLESPTTGEVYYWSRSWPRKTKSFYYEHDPDFIAAGRQVLAETREHYIKDEIPPVPDHFKWSLGPCQSCSFKPFCREDAGVPGRLRRPRPELIRTKLTESAGVDFAKTVRPTYDPHATRQRVFDEWADTANQEHLS